jgi:hypothetical protein
MDSTLKVTNVVFRVAETAADTVYSDIATHVANIEKVTWWLGEKYDLTQANLEACEVIRSICGNIRRLQQIQRNGYSRQADDGIHTLAAKYIPAAIVRVDWPKQSAAGLDNITLSCQRIAALTKQRQAAHG